MTDRHPAGRTVRARRIGPAASGPRIEAVAGLLRQYADRGVFGSLTLERAGRGAVRFRFAWLTRRPTVVRVGKAASRLTFVDLLPNVERRSSLGADLVDAIAARGSRQVPPHKRLDRRRVTIEPSFRRGALSLVVSVRGAHQPYAVRYALNLVNDIFLVLHERYPEYLVAEFGLSAE